jgi:hypothetical protein
LLRALACKSCPLPPYATELHLVCQSACIPVSPFAEPAPHEDAFPGDGDQHQTGAHPQGAVGRVRVRLHGQGPSASLLDGHAPRVLPSSPNSSETGQWRRHGSMWTCALRASRGSAGVSSLALWRRGFLTLSLARYRKTHVRCLETSLRFHACPRRYQYQPRGPSTR